jgi:hypothetical protein
MKTATLLFLAGMAAAAQAQGNVIACDGADAVLCKATVIEGRPMRELVHDGTSVAVGKPVATVEGDYRVFVRVSRVGPGKAEIRPKHFSGFSSDTAHTRLAFYDKAAEINQRIRETNRAQQAHDDALDNAPRGTGSTQAMGANKAAKLGLRKTNPNDVASKQDEASGSHGGAQQAGTIVTPEELYLIQSTLRQGDFAEGIVYFKKPKRSKVHGGLSDQLDEIDIPVNGAVFRFQ